MLRVGFVIVAAFAFAACGGDVCDDAADVLVDECGLPQADVDEGQEAAGECTGDTESLSQCIVDNSAAYCDFISDPVNNDDPCS